ncbi:MAG: tyrosine-protein phosphatase [Acidimicrobiales bacterium]
MTSSERTDAPVVEPGGAEPSRRLPIDGCVNFRDLGGYRVADGRRVRWRRLFRADGLSRLSEDDRSLLSDLGLATVIDLRTLDEAEQRGSFPVDALPVAYHSLPLTDVLPSPEELPSWAEASFVAARYADMLSGGSAVLKRSIEILAGPGALPAVFHCSAGKDRTGVLSALILAFLGVPDTVIAEDYALSGPAMNELLARLKGDYADAADVVEQFAPAILHAAPETMAQFLGEVRAEHGSYAALEHRLGVAEPMGQLRRDLLEAS